MSNIIYEGKSYLSGYMLKAKLLSSTILLAAICYQAYIDICLPVDTTVHDKYMYMYENRTIFFSNEYEPMPVSPI